MNAQQQNFESYLDEQIAACKRRSALFAADDRRDEGNLEKVRANIYEIFKTILSASERACGTDKSAQRRFFLQKAEQIPAAWAASHKKAEQHGDIEKMHIESVKLDTVREIKDRYMRIWEGMI